MKNYILLFSAFALLFFGMVYAVDKPETISYQMRIDAYNADRKTTTILLNNGTVWKYHDTDLFDEPNSWKVGDNVDIMYIHKKGYFLLNKSFRGSAPVELKNSPQHPLNIPLIQTIAKSIHTQDNGNTHEDHMITLTDGTTWYIGTWSSHWMHDWQEGDQVVVTPHEFLFGSAGHLIINLNRKLYDFEKCASNVRAELKASSKMIIKDELFNKRDARMNWDLTVKSLWISGDSTLVELSNGILLQCNTSESNWNIGDHIDLTTRDGETYEAAKNPHSSFCSTGIIRGKWINKDSKDIETLVIIKTSKKGKKFMLNDGSVWMIRKGDSDWNDGDRIVVFAKSSMSANENAHVIVNLTKTSTEAAMQIK